MLEPLTARCLSNLDGIRHGFFTRKGGVSSGIYASLNCGLGSADVRADVLENRGRVAQHLTGSPGPVVTVHQIHSATALPISGVLDQANLPKADAMVTATRGVVIGALAADCAPVLFADPVAGVIGAAHSGWRGAVSGIIESTVAAMEGLGARRANIRACIGPCINQANYEVGEEFRDTLVRQNEAYAAFFDQPENGGKPHFDLPGFVTDQLERARTGMIERQTPCSYENESLLFSYRRSTHRSEPDYGRQISAIVLL